MTPDDVQLVEDCAALAPSVHNTQPWSFHADGDVLLVRADRGRQLGYLDPHGRQLHISCGAAIEFARLGIRETGRAVSVRLLPDRADPDLLAILEVGGADPATAEERALVEAMPRRYTDRQPYADVPLPADVLDRLRDLDTAPDAWIRVVDDHDHRRSLAVILEDAEAAEAADPAYAEELERWSGPQASNEGLPSGATASWPTGVVSDVPLRDFTGHGRHPHPGGGQPPRVRRDPLVLLGTTTDEPIAWLRAGMVLGRLLLTLTAEHLVAQPLGPATDFATTRARVRRELGLVGWPQFLLRLGYGQDRPHTHRRAVEDTARG